MMKFYRGRVCHQRGIGATPSSLPFVYCTISVVSSAVSHKVVKSASVEHLPVGGGGEGVEEQEVKFVNDEEEMRAYTGNSR